MKIIAYGSLMDQNSLEITLGRKVPLSKIKLPQFRRVFNAPFGDYAFLNLAKSADATMEAASFKINLGELIKFYPREAGSELIEVMPGYYAFVWPDGYCQDLPVLRNYLEVCQEAAKKLAINFWQGTAKPKLIVGDIDTPYE